VIVTPPAVAVIVFSSATVELNVNVAIPLSPVVALAGVIVFPVPLLSMETATPATGLLAASRTVTVIVLLVTPAVMVVGLAATVEVLALVEPAVAVALKVAVPTPDTTAFAVLSPGVLPSVHRMLVSPLPSVRVLVSLGVPSLTTQVTARPGMGFPSRSRTRTTRGLGSWVPAWAF